MIPLKNAIKIKIQSLNITEPFCAHCDKIVNAPSGDHYEPLRRLWIYQHSSLEPGEPGSGPSWGYCRNPNHLFTTVLCSKLLRVVITLCKVGKWPLIRTLKCHKNIFKSKNCHIIKYFVSWLEKSNCMFCTSAFIKKRSTNKNWILIALLRSPTTLFSFWISFSNRGRSLSMSSPLLANCPHSKP